MRVVGCLAVLVAAAGLAGCGGGTNKRAVSGTVAWKSQPLETGMIRFLPGRRRRPDRDRGGHHQREVRHPQGAGAFAGQVQGGDQFPRPQERQGPPDAPPGERGGYPATERIAAKYNSKTELTAEVTADGKNHFEFQVD